MNRILTTVLLIGVFVPLASARPQDEKFGVYVVGGQDAAPVVKALKQKMHSSKPFEVVSKDDVSKVIVLIDCMPREKPTLPYACMYVLHLNGASVKTFMGGGLYLAMTPEAAADNFVVAIAKDIVERLDSTNRENLKTTLESCLMLTDTRCNVPVPLQKELGEKQMTLGQYMMSKQH